MEKQILSIALDRLDKVIAEMTMTSSTTTQLALSGVSHDLITIAGLVSERLEVKKEEET